MKRSATRMAMFRGMAIFLLGLACFLRAESTWKLTDNVENLQHQHAGGGFRLIDEVVASPSEKQDDKSKRAQQQQPRTAAMAMATATSTQAHFAEEGSENVTVLVGQPAILFCRVKNLGNKTVSWIRKRDLHILTSMALTYTGDGRFTVIGNTETSDDWNLRIGDVQPRDEGIYECQVNTEPKIHKAVYLRVLDVQAEILGTEEVYVRKGSTISLTCTVNSQGVPPSNVTWYHAGTIIDFDGPRGGVSLETEKSKGGTTSKLLITRASLTDSGNYSCVSSKAARATVVVHVLNDEHPAAMQHGGAAPARLAVCPGRVLLLLLLVFLPLVVGATMLGNRDEGGAAIVFTEASLR